MKNINISQSMPKSGRIIGEDNKIYNTAELFIAAGSDAEPVGDAEVNISQSAPRSGRIIGEDNKIYNLVDLISGISGGGTSNYTDLTNKPRINNVELVGNKSLADLGIATNGYEETVLFSNADTSNPASITLSDEYTNYDALVLVRGNMSTIWQHVIFVSQIAVGDTLSFTAESDTAWVNYDIDDATTLTRTSEQGVIVLGKILGIKFGNGAGVVDSAMSDISINPVQNKVVKEYIDDLFADILDYDEEVFPNA